MFSVLRTVPFGNISDYYTTIYVYTEMATLQCGLVRCHCVRMLPSLLDVPTFRYRRIDTRYTSFVCSSCTVQFVYRADLFFSFAVLYCRLYFGKRPFLVVSDPDFLKQILIKNFDKFQNRFVSSLYYISLYCLPCVNISLEASLNLRHL